MAVELTPREQEIRDMMKEEYPLAYPIAVAVILVAIGILIGAVLFGKGGLIDDNGYGANVYTSIVSTIVTVGFIDRFNRRRDEQNAEKQLKEQLVRDASSLVNDVAVNAVHQLRKRGWLQGDKALLVGADLILANLQASILQGANLNKVNLRKANLQAAFLNAANLQDACLENTNLQMTDLVMANLQGACLFGAKLQNANLGDANLKNANLRDANLRGTNLWMANLQEANLQNAEFDENTRLPDRTYWTPDTDMTKFTQPSDETETD